VRRGDGATVAGTTCSIAAGSSSKMLPAQKAELEALAALPDDRINTDALPQQRNWSGARRGVFFRPIKSN